MGYAHGFEAAKRESERDEAVPLSPEEQFKLQLEAAIACCPEGWTVVPIEPTAAMISAYRGALKEMIEALPKEQRNHKNPIREPFKCLGRWRAMLRAVPRPFDSRDGDGERK